MFIVVGTGLSFRVAQVKKFSKLHNALSLELSTLLHVVKTKYYTSLKGTECQKHENGDDYESTVQVNKYNPILVLHANFNFGQNQQLSLLLDTITTVFLLDTTSYKLSDLR